MVSVLFLIFGIVDFIAGIMLTFGTITLLPQIARYVGIFLIGKGLWSMFTSLAS